MGKNWQLISEGLQKLDTLTDWEKGFIESVLGQLAKGYRLSENQTKVVERIEEKSDPKNIERKVVWEAEWNDDKRKIAEICARYYLDAGYFTRLANSVLDDASFVPSEKQYKAMCENKYAQKVVAATFAEPIYCVGSMVSFRASAPWNTKQHKNGAVVISTTAAPVKSAAKGAKVYQVLPVGAVKPLVLEERDLKKFRQPKKK